MLLSLLSPLWTQAQKMTLALQTSPEVISKNTTRAIMEDSYGFIWYGGGGGLYKYDGFESKVCRPESADSAKLSLGTVQAILEEKNGDLLIGSSAGLFRYERQSDKIMPLYSGKFVKQTGGVSTVYSLHQDAAGRIWIGTETNLYVVRNPPMSRRSKYSKGMNLSLNGKCRRKGGDFRGPTRKNLRGHFQWALAGEIRFFLSAIRPG